MSTVVAFDRRGLTRRRGGRGAALLGIVLAGIVAFFALGLDVRDLVPDRGGLTVMGKFFSHAFSPALTYEASFVPAGTKPLLLKAVGAVGTTLIFAAAGLGVALILGLVLGFFASKAWWSTDVAPVRGRHRFLLGRGLRPMLYGGARLVITLMRSIHELLWALLFLAAFGLTDITAVLALALPYGGTLAKVFSEIVDEAPRGAVTALQGIGASSLQIYVYGLVVPAAPDLLAYLFYRFECAVRASAVLGFFGYPTLGYYLTASFENLHYGEVWTYLYVLVGMVVILDWWSGALRRSLSR